MDVSRLGLAALRVGLEERVGTGCPLRAADPTG